jgi:Uma2 family endonuclease
MMAQKSTANAPPENLAELMERLGGVPLERVRMRPPPGTATEKDLLEARKGPRGKSVELVEGVLVDKAMGTREALLGGILLHLLWDYLETHDLGQALPADGMLRLVQGVVRVPDVSFIRWEQLPGGQLPDEAIARLTPDLAVEILSEGNTPGEVARKVREYFLAGTSLIWVIDPRKQTAEVYTPPENRRRLGKAGTLDGGGLLPGFRVPLKHLFARTRRRSA